MPDLTNATTLRDYFIAHAPEEPQPWFNPIMPPYPKSSYTDENCQDRGPFFSTALEAEKHFQVPEEYVVNVADDDQDAWRAELKKQRYIQWPAAWADAMISQRNKDLPDNG